MTQLKFCFLHEVFLAVLTKWLSFWNFHSTLNSECTVSHLVMLPCIFFFFFHCFCPSHTEPAYYPLSLPGSFTTMTLLFCLHLSEMASSDFLSDSTFLPGFRSNNFSPWNLHSPCQPERSLNLKYLPSILLRLFLQIFLDIFHVVLITQYCKGLNFKFNLWYYGKYVVVTKLKFTSISILQISCASGSPVVVNTDI